MLAKPSGLSDLEWKVGLWANGGRMASKRIQQQAMAQALGTGSVEPNQRIAIAVAAGGDRVALELEEARRVAETVLNKTAAQAERRGL